MISTKHNLRRAVTMVEIMVVIVIIGILSAIAVPRFISTTGLSQLDADFNKVNGILKLARNKARAAGTMHFVVFSASERTVSLYKDDGSNKYDTPDIRLQIDTLGPSVRFGLRSGFSSAPTTGPAGTTGFSSTAIPASGLGDGYAVVAGGTECGGSPDFGNAAGSWSSVVNFCPDQVIGDVETGVVYLSTTRSDAKIYAILYNDQGTSGRFQFQSWVWQGGSWSAN